MKVKYLQEKIKDWNPNDDIVFCRYSYNSEAYTHITDVAVKHCRPKKKKYYHKDCANYEMVNVKDSKIGYCNKFNEIIQFPTHYGCSHFEHTDSGIVYCLNCEVCSKGYTCKGIMGE